MNPPDRQPEKLRGEAGARQVEGARHAIQENGGGNKYRVIAAIHFNRQMLFVRHVFTHAQYDQWRA